MSTRGPAQVLGSRSYPPPHSSGSEVLPGVFYELSRGWLLLGGGGKWDWGNSGLPQLCLSLTSLLLPALGSPFEE